MSLWLLFVFALSMLAAVLSFAVITPWMAISQLVFVITLIVFLLSILVQGIRKPVI